METQQTPKNVDRDIAIAHSPTMSLVQCMTAKGMKPSPCLCRCLVHHVNSFEMCMLELKPKWGRHHKSIRKRSKCPFLCIHEINGTQLARNGFDGSFNCHGAKLVNPIEHCAHLCFQQQLPNCLQLLCLTRDGKKTLKS